MPPSRKHLAPPYWAILTLPFGLAVGFGQTAMPFELRARGVDMTLIGTASGIALFPHVIKFFWSPALDAGPRRRSWFFVSVALTALMLAATALIPPSPQEHLGPVSLLWVYTGVLFVAQAAAATSASAVLALMAVTVPESLRGRASGWQTAGNLVGTSLGGALVWLFDHTSAGTTAIVLAGVCVACAVPAAFIDEAPLARAQRVAARRRARSRDRADPAVARGLDRDAHLPLAGGDGRAHGASSARSPGTTRPTTRRAERLVVLVTGAFGGLVNAAGALFGGYVADRMNRRLAYVLAGGVTALSAVAMLLAPATPTAFTVGCLAYTFANGLCYAAFYAFLLDLLGRRDGVTTQLALYAGASNLAIDVRDLVRRRELRLGEGARARERVGAARRHAGHGRADDASPASPSSA